MHFSDDSEIEMTLTALWDGGIDFALISYMELVEAGRPIDYMKVVAAVEPIERPGRADPWHNVSNAHQLAAAIHDAALGKYPNSQYAKVYGAQRRITLEPTKYQLDGHCFGIGEVTIENRGSGRWICVVAGKGILSRAGTFECESDGDTEALCERTRFWNPAEALATLEKVFLQVGALTEIQ